MEVEVEAEVEDVEIFFGGNEDGQDQEQAHQRENTGWNVLEAVREYKKRTFLKTVLYQ